MTKTLTLLPILILLSIQAPAQCNGHPLLCDKKYNEVAIVMTHNAYNYAGDFQLPNQNFAIAQQLTDGVRGFMIDVHENNGEIVVMHNAAFLGTQPLVNVLQDIKSFLIANSSEVLTIIFESHVTAADIETGLTASGLMPFLHVQMQGGAWPTLQQMITANKRLVVFSEKDDGTMGQDWYHYVWDYVVETPFSNNSVNDFTCDYNRGDPSNELFLLNHFVTTLIGTGNEGASETANSNPFFIDRAEECQTTTGKFPNFLAVDFYDKGNPFETAAHFNGLLNTSTQDLEINASLLYPNPFHDFAILEHEGLSSGATLSIYNNLGQVVRTRNISPSDQIQINRGNLPTGVYYYALRTLDRRDIGNGRFLIQ